MACFWRALFVLEPFPLGHLQGGVEISFTWLSGSWLSFGSLRVPRASPGRQGTHTDPHREAKGPASTPAPPAGTACPQQALEPRCLLTPRPSEPEGRAGARQQNSDDQLLLRGSSQASRRAHTDGSGLLWKHLSSPLTFPQTSYPTAAHLSSLQHCPCSAHHSHSTSCNAADSRHSSGCSHSSQAAAPPCSPCDTAEPRVQPPGTSTSPEHCERGSSPHHHAALGQNNHTELHKNLPPRSQAPQH